ncbi:MAG TPA: DUF4258 domain-containing protein [Blastocatellia bacterium]|nr:DUF4258 domain-containing protein [Blastocatellia bacterium]
MSVIVPFVTNDPDIHFEVLTPLGFSVRVTRSYWELIVTIKHPVMAGRESDVREALQNPDEIRVSSIDAEVYLFYKAERAKRWVCAVAKHLNGDGFLITTFPTDAVKEGVRVWPT